MRTFMLCALLFLSGSCSQPLDRSKATHTHTDPTASKISIDSTPARYTVDMVINKKDYACGMPVSAGLTDTCHYKGKAYGFCSKECKEEFLKSPDRYLAAKN